MDLVSLDEYLHSKGAGGVERVKHARDSGVILKGGPRLETKAPKFDEASDSMNFVMSAEVEDRDRDIVIQQGLDTTEFEKNPVGPWAHNSYMPPVVTWSDVQKQLSGRPKRTEGKATLVKGEDMADRLRNHFKAGSIRACSIGFMPKEIERREKPNDVEGYYYPGYKIHKAELYECSPCTIPANPAALAKAARDGDVEAMRELAEVLDTWEMKNGLFVPRERFEAAHKDATGERVSVMFKGARFEVTDEVDEHGIPVLAKAAAAIKKGDFVSWSSSGGTARGKVVQVKTDGDIAVDGATVTGTSDDPAAKITIYKKVDDAWKATDVQVAHKTSTLTKIEALKAAAEDEHEGVITRTIAGVLAALGIKSKPTEAADGDTTKDGTKPASEPTGETKSIVEQMALDIPELERKQTEAREFAIEAASREAALDEFLAAQEAA